jgi:hypothetical protein
MILPYISRGVMTSRAIHWLSTLVAIASPLVVNTALADGTRVRGEVRDADTDKLIACRVYVRHENGTWHFPASDAKEGAAVPYRKQRGNSVEMHTTLSAHPFAVSLPPGRYTFTIERGKEYFPETHAITVGDKPLDLKFRLRRWIDMASLGWYSGETHVHRTLDELPALMLAEDLNVAFPLTYWVTEAFKSPTAGGKGPARDPEPKPVAVDDMHVFYPRNTEYEIFTVGKERHTLGAIFVLNHRTLLDRGVPPVRPIAEQAHKEGALLELDKHNWPWSMMLVPVANVDLYELANNHVWRTEFGFPTFGEPAADYMRVERTKIGFTERGWLDYGFQNYYALLNCGFRLRPTAGTASGVHPVPLGFGRVYVHCPDRFGYDSWLRGLDRGESFVTTGPMLLIQVNGKNPGHTFKPGKAANEVRITGKALSSVPLGRIEVVINGEIARTIKPANRKTDRGGHESAIDERLSIDQSAWVAVRCFEEHDGGRVRFAHTAPCHFEIEGKPLLPRKQEIEFLARRVAEQIERSKDVLPAAALDEYRDALRAYRAIEQAVNRKK